MTPRHRCKHCGHDVELDPFTQEWQHVGTQATACDTGRVGGKHLGTQAAPKRENRYRRGLSR